MPRSLLALKNVSCSPCPHHHCHHKHHLHPVVIKITIPDVPPSSRRIPQTFKKTPLI